MQQNKPKKNGLVETFYNTDKQEMTPLGYFHVFCFFFALYITFKCNNGFDMGGFLAALCFPEIYIIYKYAQTDKCDLFKNVAKSAEAPVTVAKSVSK